MVGDGWNPLWSNDNYARHTRWGGIIAPPVYSDVLMYSGAALEAPPGAGFPELLYIGQDWDFFRPIRPGDAFRVFRRRPKLEDVTNLDGQGPRIFKFLAQDADLINQRDELVSISKTYYQCTLRAEPVNNYPAMPAYSYTREELEYIDRMIDREEIRGANIRYWEDVTIGDETCPVAMGPTTVWDQVNHACGTGAKPSVRDARKRGQGQMVLDPDTGVTHPSVELHMSDRIAQLQGYPGALVFMPIPRQLMARLISNWMGDDGFLRKYNWRCLQRTLVGDTFLGRGRVTGKRVENGEHLVDLVVWLDNLRGYVTEAAVATVSLCSR
jgi:acyl dehydratase